MKITLSFFFFLRKGLKLSKEASENKLHQQILSEEAKKESFMKILFFFLHSASYIDIVLRVVLEVQTRSSFT